MEGVLAALEAAPPVVWLKASRWGYMGVGAAHVLGIAMLVGAMIPLNLVRLGVMRPCSREAAGRLLVPLATAGLSLAVLSGLALFSVRAGEYAVMTVFRVKLLLVTAGAATALALHAAYGAFMQRASAVRTAVHAGVSLATWVVVLVLGRAIAFV